MFDPFRRILLFELNEKSSCNASEQSRIALCQRRHPFALPTLIERADCHSAPALSLTRLATSLTSRPRPLQKIDIAAAIKIKR
ncbi:hypothetical protein ACQCLI_08470 [Pseudomonas nitroreducens]|uniref:hypothetical protein n=1 Tax=Pseudomonas TaxID=286 RepID=UPI0012FDD5CA|nr:hypothetical protein [Pseudomonas nitroreducens]